MYASMYIHASPTFRPHNDLPFSCKPAAESAPSILHDVPAAGLPVSLQRLVRQRSRRREVDLHCVAFEFMMRIPLPSRLVAVSNVPSHAASSIQP